MIPRPENKEVDMGLFGDLNTTYDNMIGNVGRISISEDALLPLSHWATRAKIEISIDSNGTFLNARKLDDKDRECITIYPDTLESSSRTSKLAPHPLCDNLKYLAPQYDVHYSAYIKLLRSWAESENHSHPKVQAILKYVSKGTVWMDLDKAGLLSGDSTKDQGLFIRWAVISPDGGESACWKDQSLFDAWIGYYNNQLAEHLHMCVCDISGKSEPECDSHRKGVFPNAGNAKLISSNDARNFTFRGRFKTPDQCLSIGYETSQKSHAMLRYLIQNHGVVIGERVLVCWNIGAKPVPNFIKPDEGSMFDVVSSSSVEQLLPPAKYSKLIRQTLFDGQQTLVAQDNVDIASFEAATSGRLSVTYFSSLPESAFLHNIERWYQTMCISRFDVKGNQRIWSPRLYDIVKYAFGEERNGRMDVDDKLLAYYTQLLVRCVAEGRRMPIELIGSISRKHSRLPATSNLRYWSLLTAATVVRKVRNDHFGREVYKVILDTTNSNRSYLFGRLLAIYDRIERRALRKNGDSRETNANRLQEYYTKMPMKAWMTLKNLTLPYASALKQSEKLYYEKLISEIVSMLETNDAKALNMPLKEDYLLGYYQQMSDFQAGYKENETGSNEEEE